MDDTRERFLTAIVDRLGAERIVELHLFSPIRQGVMETGVAVVAALPDLPSAEAEAQRSAEAEAQWSAGEEAGAGETDAEVIAVSSADTEAPPVPVPVDATVPTPLHATVPVPLHVESSSPRHVVFTAGYRLTRKGPDRGKWSFELAATADAPLATVDMVVRGVMHRSKDLTESERLSGDQLRALLAQPAWRTTP
ncbi:MAG: hypothetical protein AABZ29_06465 [Gemmatimonadota bacterium]